MADEPPGKTSFGERWSRDRWTAEATNRFDRCTDLESKICFAQAGCHLNRQMPVRAKGLHAQLAKIWAIRSGRSVDEGQKNFGPAIARPAAKFFIAFRQQARNARGRVKCAAGHVGVFREIEGPKFLFLSRQGAVPGNVLQF